MVFDKEQIKSSVDVDTSLVHQSQYPESENQESKQGQPDQLNRQKNNWENEAVIEPRLRDLPLTVWNIPRAIVLGLIRVYQATFSRTLPPDSCRFFPSCSHYGYQAIYKYGVIKGGWLAVWRILRCNPFNQGGFDPVP